MGSIPDFWKLTIGEEPPCLRCMYGLCFGTPNLGPALGPDPESLEGGCCRRVL